ncbi:MAG: porphobilinogen synthase, partial [Candidatus Calescibacterium sp.]|nr:porphobilinogen synthase [Candidatus Calescibacterium sp.]
RMRKNKNIINLVSNVYLSPGNFIYPLFIVDGKNRKEEISSMPGVYRFSIDCLLEEIDVCLSVGINSFMLFGVEDRKDEFGSWAYRDDAIIPTAIKKLRDVYKDDVTLFADVCLCQYTVSGHCGLINNGVIDNNKTLEILNKISVVYASSGADFVCPSSMMDYQVRSIRKALDDAGFDMVGIMSYSTKFNSSFYGPFRDAALSKPQFGDRSSYQLDYRNSSLAIWESLKDVEEGADIIMVKPALAYLDIISKIKERIFVPLAAYNVSGEYSMIINSGLDVEKVTMEILHSIKRAGADIIISYFAKDLFLKMKGF